MVDYNLQVPGIAPAQSLQINPLQMLPMLQQQQLNNMLLQERARELQEGNTIRNILAQPGFNPYTPEGRQRLIAAAPKNLGPSVSKAFADIGLTQRQEQETAVRIAAAAQKMGIEKFDALVGRFATVDPADPSTYEPVYRAAVEGMPGVKIVNPKDWARLTPEQRLAERNRILTDAATIRTMVLKAEERKNERVPVTLTETPRGLVAVPKTLPPGATQVPAVPVTDPYQTPQQQSLNRAAPFVDTNPLAGVPNVPVSPARRAEMEANTQKFGGLPPPNALGSVPRNAFVAQSAQPGGPPPAQPGRPLMLPTEAEKAKGRKEGELAALEPKEARERRLTAVQSRKLVSDQIATLEDAAGKVKALKDVPAADKDAILGYSGAYTPTVFAKSREALNKYDNLKGVATAIGRFLAANEGKLGNMAVQEWQIVSDQLAALDRKVLSPTILDDQLDIISKRVSGMIARLKEGYALEHEEAIKQDPRLSLQGSTAEPPPKTGGVIDWNDLAPGKR